MWNTTVSLTVNINQNQNQSKEHNIKKAGFIHSVQVNIVFYLPVLCIAEIIIQIMSHCIKHDRVLYPAPGESVPHQPHPPRLSIHTLSDAIVWVSARIISIRVMESRFDLHGTEFQAHSFSLLAVLLSHRGTHPDQGVLHIP